MLLPISLPVNQKDYLPKTSHEIGHNDLESRKEGGRYIFSNRGMIYNHGEVNNSGRTNWGRGRHKHTKNCNKVPQSSKSTFLEPVAR